MLNQAWNLSAKTLIYLQPFYQERVLFAEEEQRQQAELNDTDIEFQSCIAQLLSLMETINVQRSQTAMSSDDKKHILLLVTSFCHLGKSAESLFAED